MAVFYSTRVCLFFLLIGCGNPLPSATEQCENGATAVDGVSCCQAVISGKACKPGDECIADSFAVCTCLNSAWRCEGDPVHADLSVLRSRD